MRVFFSRLVVYLSIASLLASASYGLSLVDAGCPDALKELIARCWADSAADRPSFADALDQLQRIEPKADSFATSNFKLEYERMQAPQFAHELLAAVQQLIDAYCKLHSLSERFTPM